MKRFGKVVSCDYPGCTECVLLEKIGTKELDGGTTIADIYETIPDNWGQVNSKDLCPDHWQYYQDAIAAFWDQPIGKHAVSDADELAEMLEADNSIVEPELKNEDILYTNMAEMKDEVW